MKENKKTIISIIAAILLTITSAIIGYLTTKSNLENQKTNNENNVTETTKKEDNQTETEEKEDSEPVESETEKNDREEKTEISISITYEEETYITKNKNNIKITDSSRNIPHIVFNTDENISTKITNSLKKLSDSEWQNIKESADDITNSEETEYETEYQGLGATLLFSELKNTGNNRQTFYLNLEGNFGGVNWYNHWGYTYDIKTGELLTLKTITNDYQELYNIIEEEVNTELEDLKKEIEIYDKTPEEIEKIINTNGNWMFTETGIEIIFQKYELSDGSTGPITISINKDKINNILKDEYKF